MRLVVLVVGVVGCGPRVVALEPKRIASVELSAADNALCANNDATALRAIVRYRDGSVLMSRARGSDEPDALIRRGELLWATNTGAIAVDDSLQPPPDRTSWFEHPVDIAVAVARDPSRSARLTLQPRYDCGRLNASGTPGRDGANGRDGIGVQVALAYVDLPAQRRWVLARVTVDGVPGVRHYVIDPAIPHRFTLDVRGGAGGMGVTGSSGSSGSDGSSGTDGSSGSSGSGCSDGGDGGDGGSGSNGGDGGDGGDGGNGGNGGNGGVVSVQYDARFPELVRVLAYATDGGAAGPGGHGGSGGSGGRGGRGGRGGSGGSGGSGTNPDGSYCSTSSGRSGSDGSSGSDGRSGSNGRAGSPGQRGERGEVRAVAADVALMFADELARDVPIVRP